MDGINELLPQGKEISEATVAEREANAARLWTRGLDSDDVAAVHGTSIESLQSAFQAGVLPGATEPDPVMRPGAFYFMAVNGHFPFDKIPDLDGDIREYYEESDLGYAVEDVSGYAEMAGTSHRLLTILGAPLSSNATDAIRVITNYGKPKPINIDLRQSLPIILALAGSKEKLDQAVQDARGRKGIVLGIKPDIFEKYTPSVGDNYDLKIETGDEGFPLEYISGILAIGEEEQQYFEELCRKHAIPVPQGIEPAYLAARF
mgnify:CR=1 FL=1